MLQQSEEFKKNVNDLVNEFRTKGPFSSELKPDEALSQIDLMKAKLAKLKEEELELRRGLGIFKVDHPFSKDIQNLEKVTYNDTIILTQIFKFDCYFMNSLKGH